MKKINLIALSFLILYSCQGLKGAQKGNFQQRMQRVTPSDIQTHTQKILIGKYQYQIEESQQSRTAIYMETSWKNVELLQDEIEKDLKNVRVRFKVRSRETRSGPQNRYSVHNLKFNAEVEVHKNTNGNFNWIRATITPQRNDYLQNIYEDYKLEFDSGVMNFN